MLNGIYAISNTTLTPYSNLENALALAIKGGIALFQLRDKTTNDEELAKYCEKTMQICRDSNVIFVLNDRIELAKSLKCQALHIGKKDDDTPYSLKEIQNIRKEFHGILGISCYGDLNLAHNAIQARADYIAFGACFPSQIKPNAKTIPLDLFNHNFGIPTCAIGGINTDNISKLKNAQMVACISSIWNGDIKKNVESLKKAWKKVEN